MQGRQHIASLCHLPEHSPVLGFPGLGEGWWARGGPAGRFLRG